MAQTPKTITLDLVIDTAALEEGLALLKAQMTTLGEEMQRAARKIATTLSRGVAGMSRAVNAPAYVAGLSSRYYVRASMDPACASPEAVGALVRAVLRAPQDLDGASPFDALLSAENRAYIASEVLRGWSAHRDSDEACASLAWHRFLGGSVVTVGVA